jgi:cellulose synthase/poly-beta-1,6-N-acetylglucosamine synthase-like glycosyltransferase
MKQYIPVPHSIEASALFGSNTVLRRECLESVGLYDERLRTNGEDMYISKKLRAAGYRLVYDPRALAFHLKTDTLTSLARASWAWITYGRGAPVRTSRWLIHVFTWNAGFYLYLAVRDILELKLWASAISLSFIPTHIKHTLNLYRNLTRCHHKYLLRLSKSALP